MILEGSVSIKAAVLNRKRRVVRILADEKKHDRDLNFILRQAEEAGIPVERVKAETVAETASGRTHGGIIAEAYGRKYETIDDCLKEENPFFALIEGVEDPFNLGYIARTLYSCGCGGMILRKREWAEAEAVILRSSAGAFDAMNIVMSDDPASLVRDLKEKGFRCFAAMRKDAVVYDEPDYTGPVLLAVGGEMRGLSAGVRQQMDQNIYIPYANDFRNALNAAGAAAVLGFEVFRQRRIAGRRSGSEAV